MTVTKEEVRVRGTELADKIKQLIHEGNVRRVIVRNPQGHTVLEVPVAVGVVAFIAAPVVTAVAAIAALAAEWPIEIQRLTPEEPPAPPLTAAVEAEAEGGDEVVTTAR
ncbi:DUF4342 domain-containing protein [Microbispora sp. NPDC049125]|uniref:DUF4342 domain-containing protein n=1 Tax=Microbispora sp. NPDC049125 TaxID=3154929 RepID=UPI003464FEF4